jgi:hypothetical protein
MFALKFHEAIARRKLNASPDWQACVFTRIGPDAIRLDGAVPKFMTRGPRKGQPTWKGMKLAACVVTDAEAQAEFAAYEASTGNCSQCQGSARIVSGWNVKDGATYCACPKCNGSGRAKQERTEHAEA